jgi:hypothetical protein
MTPIRIGAALDVADLPRYRDWLIAGQRDLEIQDFYATDVLLGDWEGLAARAKAHLDGFEGRLGIHGPFVNVPMNCNDAELRPIVTNRYLTGLKAAIAVGASQMVVHSPFSIWDDKNYGDKPGWGNAPSLKDSIIAACHEVMAPVVKQAEDHGVTLVIENCDDISPMDRLDLAKSFASAAVKVSIDTGHAHNSHCAQGRCPWTTSSWRQVSGWTTCICRTPTVLPIATGHPGAARSTGGASSRPSPRRRPTRIWCWSCATGPTSPMP